MPSMKEYAIQYQELGFSVIPIHPEKKRPLIDFADKPALTKEEVKAVWGRYPDANIALKTTDFFVLDIDCHGKADGFESLKRWKDLNLIQPTVQAKTASGGRHLFYKKREDCPISQMIGFLPGVDIKAHENNYVLVAPSATEKGQYEWYLEKSSPDMTMTTPKKELIKAIKEAYQKSHGTTEDRTGGLRALAMRSQKREKNQTTELFETIARGLGDEGGRNDRLANFVGGLLFRAVDEEVVFDLAKMANENSPEPLSEKEVARTVESMIKKDRR